MTQTTFTVFSPDSSDCVYGRGLSAAEAAELVLTHDGYAYEVRDSGPEHRVESEAQWKIWSSDASENSTGGARHFNPIIGIAAYAATAEAAWPVLAGQVVQAANGWRRSPHVMTDAEYDAMLHEAAE